MRITNGKTIGRTLALSATILAMCAGIAGAEASTGLAGSVIDDRTNGTVPGVAIVVVGLPEHGATRRTLVADKKGFFVDLGLAPGRYAVTASVEGRSSTCVIDEVYSGQVRHMRLHLRVHTVQGQCIAAYEHRQAVNPDDTTDTYRVH